MDWIINNIGLFLVLVALGIVLLIYGISALFRAVKKIPIPKGLKRLWRFIKMALLFLALAVFFLAVQDKIAEIIKFIK